MSKLLKIITHPHPVLRKKSVEVEIDKLSSPEMKELLLDMEETMKKKDGAGLAAPQIGLNLRLVVIHDENRTSFLINPKITKKSWARETEEEGCLSVVDEKNNIIYGPVSRHKKINCSYFDEKGRKKTITAEKMLARVIQHEIDHLDGILFIDRLEDPSNKISKTSKSSKKSSAPSPVRTLFMGTPEFALPGLESLLKNPAFEIIGVYTRADKPVGRKQLLTPPPVKTLAEKHDIPVFQPEKIKPEVEAIRALSPDLIVVIAYGKVIPQEILDIPKYGCINVHASLLPKYRGAACLNAPILNGDSETGITIMQIDAGLDTGPILSQASIALQGNETLSEVHDRLAKLGAELLPKTIEDWVAGKIKAKTQDESQASYVKVLTKEDGRLDWNKSATELERMWRAFHPWPGVHTYDEKGKMIKFLDLRLMSESEVKSEKIEKNGQISIKNDKLVVKCGQDYLVILKLQTEGGRPLAAKEFLAGHHNFIGQTLR